MHQVVVHPYFFNDRTEGTDRLDATGRLLIVPFFIGQRSPRTLLRLEELLIRIVAGFAEIAES